MVSDFMVCVDRIIASTACLQSIHNIAGAGTTFAGGSPEVVVEAEGCSDGRKLGAVASGRGGGGDAVKNVAMKRGGEMIECRICQEEGDDAEMEAPCACNGTLKFAHRKCIQKWCNKKGDITCEICNQVFLPNYSVPPSRPSAAVVAIDIRQSWGAQIDLNDSHYLAIAAAEEELLSAEYDDYTTASSRGMACCRAVILILMILLLILHIVLATREIGTVQDISSLFNVLLEIVGFFVPCFVIARSCYFIQSRRRRQM